MKSYCPTKNSSISTCMIPSEWKSAKVSPIYKSGDKSDPNNYRLISVLQLISKIMESAIQCQFVAMFAKQGSTHNTKEGNDQRSIQNVRVGRFGNTKKSPQMYLSF